MATLNRATWQSKFADFINRVSPFNAQPLIQKSEHNTLVGTDLGDSVIFRAGTSASITSPSGTFNVNFSTGDQININTSGSVATAFTLTLQNLNTNETGVLNVTKKSGDTIAFANAVIAPFDDTGSQVGKTALKFFIKKISSDYVAIIGYDFDVNTGNIKDDAVTTAKILNGNVTLAKLATSAKPVYGSFSPTIQFGGANVGVTYVVRDGVFYKTPVNDAANLFIWDFWIYIELSSKGSSIGTLSIADMPWSSSSPGVGGDYALSSVMQIQGFTAGEPIYAHTFASGNFNRLVFSEGGIYNDVINNTQVTNTMSFFLQGRTVRQ